MTRALINDRQGRCEEPAEEGPWLPIETAPKDGTSVRVGHRLDPSSMKVDAKHFITTGAFGASGWACSAGFVCTDGMFRFNPTHWMPRARAQSGAAS